MMDQSPTLRARVSHLQLSIFVPYPPDLVEEIRLENALAKQALAPFPHFGLPPTRVEETAEATKFMNAVDIAAVRAELNRKARKVGVSEKSGAFPVEVDMTNTGVVFSAWWRGRDLGMA